MPGWRRAASFMLLITSSTLAEYLAKTEGHKVTLAEVNAQVDAIGPRLATLFAEADASGLATDVVADRTAQALIGR